ncbi:hypothetical protein ABH904_002910 [Pseudomonas frederiksbergensis]
MKQRPRIYYTESQRKLWEMVVFVADLKFELHSP